MRKTFTALRKRLSTSINCVTVTAERITLGIDRGRFPEQEWLPEAPASRKPTKVDASGRVLFGSTLHGCLWPYTAEGFAREGLILIDDATSSPKGTKIHLYPRAEDRTLASWRDETYDVLHGSRIADFPAVAKLGDGRLLAAFRLPHGKVRISVQTRETFLSHLDNPQRKIDRLQLAAGKRFASSL